MAKGLELARFVEPLGITLPGQIPNRARSEETKLHGDFAGEIERLTADKRGKKIKMSRRNGLHALIIKAIRGEDRVGEGTGEYFDESYLSGPHYSATLEAPFVIEGLGTELVQRVSWNASQCRDRTDQPPALNIAISATIGAPKDPEAGILPNLPLLQALGVRDVSSETDSLASPYSYRDAGIDFQIADGPSPAKHRLFGQGIALLRAVEPDMLERARIQG